MSTFPSRKISFISSGLHFSRLLERRSLIRKQINRLASFSSFSNLTQQKRYTYILNTYFSASFLSFWGGGLRTSPRRLLAVLRLSAHSSLQETSFDSCLLLDVSSLSIFPVVASSLSAPGLRLGSRSISDTRPGRCLVFFPLGPSFWEKQGLGRIFRFPPAARSEKPAQLL